MFCPSTLSLLLLYSNQSFLTSHNHSCCLALDYLLLDNILQCSAKNWWKYSSWDLTSVEQAGNTLDVSLSSTSMTVAGPCSFSDLLQASQPLKNCRCSPSCVLQLTIRSAISSTSFYWTSPFFFPGHFSNSSQLFWVPTQIFTIPIHIFWQSIL